MATTLYLLPSLLGETAYNEVLPDKNREIIGSLRHFIVEDIRTARRFLKQVDKDIVIEDLTFYELNEHTTVAQIASLLTPLKNGNNVGLMSDAGCPGIADPGADVVAMAHAADIKVVPLVGPSSIFLALMASGMNGQNFAFNGYLPVKSDEKAKKIRDLERRALSDNQCQVFIEAPYRNNKLFDDFLTVCNANTRLCVAADITTATEFIETKSIIHWKKKRPDLHKRPTIFIIGR
jgi:16S rRNA (cytidine1402-2'-O)-methyltransferase